MATSVQACYNALEQGYLITLWDGSTLHKRPTGEYVYTPYVVEEESHLLTFQRERVELSSEDLDTLFAVIVLREAIFEQEIVDADDAPSPWRQIVDA